MSLAMFTIIPSATRSLEPDGGDGGITGDHGIEDIAADLSRPLGMGQFAWKNGACPATGANVVASKFCQTVASRRVDRPERGQSVLKKGAATAPLAG